MKFQTIVILISKIVKKIKLILSKNENMSTELQVKKLLKTNQCCTEKINDMLEVDNKYVSLNISKFSYFLINTKFFTWPLSYPIY